MCHMFEQKRNKIIRNCDISVDEVCGTSPDITRNRERERERMEPTNSIWVSRERVESGAGLSALCYWWPDPTRARNIRTQGSLAAVAQATKTKRCCAFLFVSFGGVCIDKGCPLHLHTRHYVQTWLSPDSVLDNFIINSWHPQSRS